MKINSALILDIVYPIGSYYWNNSLIDIDNVIGGHWERVKDKFVLAVGDTYTTSGATGGEATHTLTVNEIPEHNHPYNKGTTNVFETLFVSNDAQAGYGAASGSSGMKGGYASIGNTGGSQAHNNMPPYITAYCWKRIS